MAGTITCDRCGGPIPPEQFASIETEGDRHFHRDCPPTAAAETFRCDGEGCEKMFPVQLLREGKAGVAGDRIYCPRCLIKNVGLQRRKVDAWMVATVVLIVLVFPISVGMIFSVKAPEDDGPKAPGAGGLATAPRLPGSRRAAEPMDREELADLLREVLAEMHDEDPVGPAAGGARQRPPVAAEEPEPATEPDPPAGVRQAADPDRQAAADPPGRDPDPTPDPTPAVDLAALDEEVDRAVRDALFERLNASRDPDEFPARLAALVAIRTAGRSDWGTDLDPYLSAIAEDELIRSLAAATAADLGAAASAASLRRAAADGTSDLVRETSRQALREVTGNPPEAPAGDQDVDWGGALERHDRVASESGR